MKLRIKGDSLRMRLSQGEVDILIEAESVSDVINFGNAKLTYQLIFTDTTKASAMYDNDCVSIYIPKQIGIRWASSDQVSIEETIPLDDGSSLSILMEKDFKCLTDRPNEDESDLFENPICKHDC